MHSRTRHTIWMTSVSALAFLAIGAGEAFSQTPETSADNAAEQMLDKTRDDTVLQQLKKQREKKNLNVDEEADKLDSNSTILGEGLPSAENMRLLKRKMQDEPNNLDHYFLYAQMATALNEHAEAARTYEAMLQKAPELDRVRLDLGASYMRLGRLEDAQRELKTVLERNPPEQVKANINSILAKLDGELREHDISGSVSMGMNYDSNANSAPESGKILLFDTLIPLGASQRVEDDLQFFAAANLTHSYRPHWGKGETIWGKWDTEIGAYHAEQSELENLDLKVFSIKTGPEFQSNQSGIKVSPKISHQHIVLGTRTYLRNTAGEVTIDVPVSDSVTITGGVKHEFRQFENPPSITTYEDRTGTAGQATIGARWVPTPTDFVTIQATTRRERTRVEYYDNEQLGANVSYTHIFPYEIFASATAGYRNTVYDGPDYLLSGKTRHDKERSAGLTIGKQINARITATIGYQYRDVSSNMPNYEYDNHRFTTALSIRF